MFHIVPGNALLSISSKCQLAECFSSGSSCSKIIPVISLFHGPLFINIFLYFSLCSSVSGTPRANCLATEAFLSINLAILNIPATYLVIPVFQVHPKSYRKVSWVANIQNDMDI